MKPHILIKIIPTRYLQVSQSVTTGYTIGLANAADFKNYGVEMDLGLTPLINIGKGRIDFKINATYNNNKVTSTLGNIPVIIGGSNQALFKILQVLRQ